MSTADTQFDIRVDADRDIEITGSGDIARTRDAEEYIANFLAVTSGFILQELIGNPSDAPTYKAVQSEMYEALSQNDQIDDVLIVAITEVDTRTGTVTVEIELVENTQYTIEVSV